MSALIDEIKESFEKSRMDDGGDQSWTVIDGNSAGELAPGFQAMREYYSERLLASARRGYRFHAGATMPTSPVALIELTVNQMTPLVATSVLGAFTDGVMVGHREDHLVRMCFHYDHVEHLFHDDNFHQASLQMANGLIGDPEIREYFQDYVRGGLLQISHVTGFAHSNEVSPGKIWDIWLLSGASCVAASYLAGNRLGTAWRERDVLDGIAIATEEVPRGSDGEAEPDL